MKDLTNICENIDGEYKAGTYNVIFRTTCDLELGVVFRYPSVLYNERLVFPPQHIRFSRFEQLVLYSRS